MISRFCCWLGIAFLLFLNIGAGSALYTPNYLAAETSSDALRARYPGDDILATTPETVLDVHDGQSSSTIYLQSDLSAGQLAKRVIWSPRVLTPSSATVWQRGSKAVVVWDVGSPPQNASGSRGTIYLGHIQSGSTNEHLDTEHPLANGFSLSSGSVEVQVPNVEPGHNYIVVLMGDSGNRSPAFTIQ